MYLDYLVSGAVLRVDVERVRGFLGRRRGQIEMLHGFTFVLRLRGIWAIDLNGFDTFALRIVYLGPRKSYRGAWEAVFGLQAPLPYPLSMPFQMAHGRHILRRCARYLPNSPIMGEEWHLGWHLEWQLNIILKRNVLNGVTFGVTNPMVFCARIPPILSKKWQKNGF